MIQSPESNSEIANDADAERRTWVLTEVYFPEEISTGYYLTAIAEGLALDGPVTVLTGQPKHMARGQRAARREVRNGVEIVRSAKQEPWGLHEMWVTDPDGVAIVLVEVPADHPIRRDNRQSDSA